MDMNCGQLLCGGRIWVRHVEVASTRWQRMRGLLGRRVLPAGHGLLLEACGAVHTVGMRFPIDVIFFDRTWQVRRVCRHVPPGRWMVWGGWRGLQALEVACGWLDLDDIRPGVPVEWQDINTPTAGG
jgi:uncharacterized membrane protein (UPF0127 family)